MKQRCKWAEKPIFHNYHDCEWGFPTKDERLLFELLILEGAQAGLSWETILKKRQAYKEAYDNFVVEKVALYAEGKIQELLQNSGIVRNRLKIHSSTLNAKVFIAIQQEYGSFAKYIWGFTQGKVIDTPRKNHNELPATTCLSDEVSKDLRRKGMKFVGSTIIYSYLQAIGIVNDHELDCFVRK